MSQYNFGAGNFFGVPGGANPTPIRCGVLQEVTIDFSATLKELVGQYQYAAAIGRGQIKVTGKAKFAKISANAYNSLFFNDTVTTGMTLLALDELITIPATPFKAVVANGATFSQDLGLVDALTGLPLTRVASAPITGQYSLSPSTGEYTFAAADTGKMVVGCYMYTNATRGYTVTLNNKLMGVAPTFLGVFAGTFGGKQLNMILNSLTSNKLSIIGTKTEDFSIPEVDFQASVNAANILGILSSDD